MSHFFPTNSQVAFLCISVQALRHSNVFLPHSPSKILSPPLQIDSMQMSPGLRPCPSVHSHSPIAVPVIVYLGLSLLGSSLHPPYFPLPFVLLLPLFLVGCHLQIVSFIRRVLPNGFVPLALLLQIRLNLQLLTMGGKQYADVKYALLLNSNEDFF